MTQQSDSPVRFTDVEFHNADHLGEIYSGPNISYTRSDAGPFHSQMTKAILGRLAFHTNRHESHLLIEGANSHGLVAVGFQSPGSVARRMMGEWFTNADVFIAGPRVEHFANVMPGQVTFQIFMPNEPLANELAARLNREAFDLTGRRYQLRPGRQVVGKLIDIVTQSTHTVQELIHSSPSPETLEQLQKAFVERVVTILLAGDNDLTRERDSLSSTGWVLLQAREYFEENRGTPIRLADVCRAVGVSQRMLQIAFADGLGITPMKYLKLRRLHLVRERLQSTTADEVTVTVAAREAGFVDLSRFARDYKELFGQLPSETQRA